MGPCFQMKYHIFLHVGNSVLLCPWGALVEVEQWPIAHRGVFLTTPSMFCTTLPASKRAGHWQKKTLV